MMQFSDTLNHIKGVGMEVEGRRSGCRFCAVKTSNKPPPLDALEPLKSHGSHKLGGRLCVLTNVDRDDLPDGESGHSAQTVRALKVFQEMNPRILVDCLTSYFRGDMEAVSSIATLKLWRFNHHFLSRIKTSAKQIRGHHACL